MEIFTKWLLSRGSEASTYGGLGVLMGLLHISLSGEMTQAITAVLMALSGLISIVIKERGA